jgi:hypothetical protein
MAHVDVSYCGALSRDRCASGALQCGISETAVLASTDITKTGCGE